MGKIGDALNKYKKEKKTSPRLKKLKPGDYEALLQYDPKAGKLDLKHPLVISDPGTVERLITYRLIETDGSLTPAGKVRYTELKTPKPKTGGNPPASGPEKQSGRPKPKQASEWHEIETGVSETDPKAELKLVVGEKEETTPSDKHIDDTGKNAATAGKPAQKPTEPKTESAAPAKPGEIKTEAKPVAEKAPATGLSAPPLQNPSMDQSLVAFFNPQSFEAEQFNILRSNLLYPVSGKPPRLLMVTSPMPGEGKSFVAANLAISVARNINRYVLLMDCDLRRPSIHTRFGYDDVPGLSDYLADGTELSELLLRTSIDNLTILPGGRPPNNPSELLSSERMSELLAEASTRYPDRLIILDSPPPALTAETSVLARRVDGVVIVIKHGKTSREGVADVIDKMGKEKILGAVINNFEVYSSRYYGKYYGYPKYGAYGYRKKDKKQKKAST